jgi:hypothetical protein
MYAESRDAIIFVWTVGPASHMTEAVTQCNSDTTFTFRRHGGCYSTRILTHEKYTCIWVDSEKTNEHNEIYL